MNTVSSSHVASVAVSPRAKRSITATSDGPTTAYGTCDCLQRRTTPSGIPVRSFGFGKKCVVCGLDCGRPALLDLFSGAGGAAKGYRLAGFCVLGVDHKPQPRYIPYGGCLFVQGDALEYVKAHGHEFDAIHASPPCQDHMMTPHRRHGTGWMLSATRDALRGAWVIENVPGAPMRPDYVICGCPKLRRVRWFETSWRGFAMMPTCNHATPAVSVVGHGTPSWVKKKLGRNPTITEYRDAMGIDWMNRNELSQAIPPAYCEFIGKQLLAALEPGGGSARI
jgi:DNA (cytosine-5)-methyltransferase 1